MSLLAFLDQVGTFQRATSTSDASGGTVRTFATIAGLDAVPVSVQPIRGYVVQQYAQQQMQVSHNIYTNVNTASQLNDRVLIGGQTYLVQQFKVFSSKTLTVGPLYVVVAQLQLI